jgi:ADP-ribosylglycohydrolase
MEDKWFIFYENRFLYMHRSWTGFGIYKAEIIKKGEFYAFDEFMTERNKEKNSNEDDEADKDIFVNLIAGGLLGIPAGILHNKPNNDTNLLSDWGTYGSLLLQIAVRGTIDDIKAALFGVAVGDALGVPVEFKNRPKLKENPITGMIGGGSHNQLPGTWSDDSSLTFCLAEALTKGFNLDIAATYFVNWYYFGYWSARKEVFDVGNSTQEAIIRLRNDTKPELAGNNTPDSNGNGSLMRILPLLFYTMDMPIDKRFELTNQVSSMTHRHIRSVIACFYYLEFARQILQQRDKSEIYADLQKEITDFLISKKVDNKQISYFDRLLSGNIVDLSEDDVFSDGYVLHTLEASVWCLMTTDNFKDAVLKAVNLGEDTDTTGAVTGGLAGLYYGFESIPQEWIKQLARSEDIEDLAQQLGKSLEGQ